MVRKFGSFYVICPVSSIKLLIAHDIFYKVTTRTVINGPLQTIPKVKLKQCGKPLIIRGYFTSTRKNFTHDVKVFRLTLLFIISIQFIIESSQESRIFWTSSIMIDMFHCIKTESIYSTVYPSLSCCDHSLECRRTFQIRQFTVIKVGKGGCIEMRVIIP